MVHSLRASCCAKFSEFTKKKISFKTCFERNYLIVRNVIMSGLLQNECEHYSTPSRTYK